VSEKSYGVTVKGADSLHQRLYSDIRIAGIFEHILGSSCAERAVNGGQRLEQSSDIRPQRWFHF